MITDIPRIKKPCWLKEMAKPAIDRFAGFLLLDDKTNCWLWTGARHRLGYGTFRTAGKTLSAHRWSYEFFIGPIPPGKEVHHECENEGCVNPHHLRAVTHIEHSDFHRKKTHCRNGHPYEPGSFVVHNAKTGLRRICKTCYAINMANYKERQRKLKTASVGNL